MTKPILFNTEMVKAILDGRKIQTRRIVKPHRKATIENMWFDKNDNDVVAVYSDNNHIGEKGYINPQYQVNDILYVRETWSTQYDGVHDDNGYGKYVYKADGTILDNSEMISSSRWYPSIHMPKEAARIFLRVTGVRVERLQDMRSCDAWDEGARCNCMSPVPDCAGNKLAFKKIWDSTVKKSDLDRYGWEANPWVWVYEFERCESPCDTCINAGWETTDRVAACNCCENYEFYQPDPRLINKAETGNPVTETKLVEIDHVKTEVLE